MNESITQIAQQLKATHKDLHGRLKECKEKQREFSRLAHLETDAINIIENDIEAVEAAYKRLVGAEIAA